MKKHVWRVEFSCEKYHDDVCYYVFANSAAMAEKKGKKLSDEHYEKGSRPYCQRVSFECTVVA